MKIKGAISVLKKEAEFLGMSFDEVLVFIEQKPWAASQKHALPTKFAKRSFWDEFNERFF